MRAVLLALLVAVACAGCAAPEEPAPDRGPPRLLDDGSRPFPEATCAALNEPIGWNASFYNVGGAGRVYVALFVEGDMKTALVMDLAADAPGWANLSWTPTTYDGYDMEVRWGLNGSAEAMQTPLAGPEVRGYPCATFCPRPTINMGGPECEAFGNAYDAVAARPRA